MQSTRLCSADVRFIPIQLHFYLLLISAEDLQIGKASHEILGGSTAEQKGKTKEE